MNVWCYFIVNFRISSWIFRIFWTKNRPSVVYSLWPSEALAVAELTTFITFYMVAMLWMCVCAVYHLSWPLCVYANEWLFVGVFFPHRVSFSSAPCIQSLCALLIVFTDFASLILHTFNFGRCISCGWDFFLPFSLFQAALYKFIYYFCSFCFPYTLFACGDIRSCYLLASL